MFFQATLSSILRRKTHGSFRTITSIAVDNNPLKNYESFSPKLRATISQLDQIAPRFELNKGDIEILNHPVKFYETLKEKINNANDRIFLSSLYIGKSQDDLINCISKNLKSKPNLKVYILTDYLRSTREEPENCPAKLLSKLTKEFGNNRVDIRFYHTPNLKGFAKMLIPKRLNEGWGLQHMKIYGFDNEVILSGANLSQDYFTNRQDRYYLFKDTNLSNYYFNLQNTISSISYKLINAPSQKSGYYLDWPTSNNIFEPHLNTEKFITESTRLLLPVLKTHGGMFIDKYKKAENKKDENDDNKPESLADPPTIVYPVSQFTPLLKTDYSTEKPSILRLLSFLNSRTIKWYFTAGYFNMHPQIKRKLVESIADGEVITASPKANSFYKSKGISYYLPEAYLYQSKKFLELIEKNDKKSQIKLLEWQNGIVNTIKGWSYHAKGIWITNNDEEKPCITVIGSSNYTRRAYSLDLETNAIIITKDEELKTKMMEEVNNLKNFTKQLTLKDFETDEERKINIGVKFAAHLLRDML